MIFLRLLLIFNFATAELPSINYSWEQRTQYINRVFRAFEKAGYKIAPNAQEFLRTQSQYSCAAQTEQLKIQCLIQQATANCSTFRGGDTGSCELISDVIVSNIIEERSFIDRDELTKILSSEHSSRSQLMTAINGRYARLTADFLSATKGQCINPNAPCFAQQIDRFCNDRANTKKVSWQGCVGALIWFIGSNLKPTGDYRHVKKNL
jgi:hypothetical protein